MKIEIKDESVNAFLKLSTKITAQMCEEVAGSKDEAVELREAMIDLLSEITSKSK